MFILQWAAAGDGNWDILFLRVFPLIFKNHMVILVVHLLLHKGGVYMDFLDLPPFPDIVFLEAQKWDWEPHPNILFSSKFYVMESYQFLFFSQFAVGTFFILLNFSPFV